VVSVTLTITISVIGVAAAGIIVHRFHASGVVVTIVVGDDGCVRRDRVTVGPRTHIIVRLDHAVSGSVAIAATVTGIRVVSTAAACSQTGSSE
jgi:hypothetical protein